MKYIFILIIFLASSARAESQSDSKFPYYASIKAEEANIRTGPSVRYPIQWVYNKANWPVEVTASFEGWRKIRDIKGEIGWIHEALLSGKRNTIINTNGVQELYRLPINNSKVIAIVENGVLAKLNECKNNWCKIETGDTKGWIESKYLWGVDEGEVID
jgi:SH3-like domain-containing protein